MVVLWLETKKQNKKTVDLEAFLAPASVEVGAVAKADQQIFFMTVKPAVPFNIAIYIVS